MATLPRRYLPSLASLRALEALDRLGTATAAAEELSLTQSAVSRQLQVLEDQLGATLIIRSRQRMLMTEAGARYAGEVRGALNAIARASMQLHAPLDVGALQLAILPSFGMRWLVPRLPDFSARYPDITVNLSTRLRPVDFNAENFDAAIQYGAGDWAECDSLLLRSERLIPVCAPDLLDSGPVTDLRALLELPLLHIETRPQAWARWLTAKGVDVPSAPTGATFDQYSTITQAAVHGMGVALLPDFIAEQELATGKLVCAATTDSAQALGAYYLVWPKSRVSPALRVFRDWIASHTGGDDGLPR